MEVGLFKSKLFSIGGGFHVFDAQKQLIADVKGDWKGWNFGFLAPDGSELGKVTKKWAGLAWPSISFTRKNKDQRCCAGAGSFC